MDTHERHADVVSRYPGGLTPAQFRHEALASADADGKLDPPALGDWFAQQSLLIRMWMDGLIERRGRRDEPGPWYLARRLDSVQVAALSASAGAASKPINEAQVAEATVRRLMQVAHKWAAEPDNPDTGRTDILEIELRKAFAAGVKA